MPNSGDAAGASPQATGQSEPDPDRSSPSPSHAAATVRVDLGARSYDIRVGPGLLADAGHHLKPLLRRPRVVIVTDENVAAHHLEKLRSGLERAGITENSIILPPGEQTKDFANLAALLDRLLELEVERGDLVIAFGGGVIGDLTGFAASILRRGVDFVQIPTTLLAQVDSSVGGKTGINTRHGKNLVGSFHQPRLVLADTESLNSLPPREWRAGYAEVVKYGLIDDPEFFAWLEENGTNVLAGDPAALAHAVVTSCRAKARIVRADERESGQRALLNLGHTFGHALEAELGYSDRLLHGEAVAIGMQIAFDLSVSLGLCPAEDAERLRRHLAATGLAAHAGELGVALTPERLIDHMAQDKKARAGRITFVLTKGIGRAFLTRDVPPEALTAALKASIDRRR